jgi:hypothetical protein
MNQTEIVKRITSICAEFDAREKQVGIKFARLELARAMAENEASTTETLAAYKKVAEAARWANGYLIRNGKEYTVLDAALKELDKVTNG